MSSQNELIKALQNPKVWPHSASDIQLVETHISYVLLVGDFAYKIKKPLDLGFLDFSSLDMRRAYCEKELALNQRLAPDLYLDVIAITKGKFGLEISGSGPVLEYAVRMRRFPEDGLLSEQAESLTPELIDNLAHKVASFHTSIPSADEQVEFGIPDTVFAPMQENFKQIFALEHEDEISARLDSLQQWSEHAFNDLKGTIAARKAAGFVRECHGDMHLGNVTLINGEPLIFDGIEFNENLRWIDVISEVAFLQMDLEHKGCPELAQRFLNTYLEQTGDYDGLELLRFYKVYRAMVRAKVTAIRMAQDDLDEQELAHLRQDLTAYLDLAESHTSPGLPAIILTHGFSGSGKSFQARLLSMWLPAVQVRSDVERKRLSGYSPNADTSSDIGKGIYGEKATFETYKKLLDLSEDMAAFGFTVIVDATFLKLEQRQMFMTMAQRMLIPFVILDMQESTEVLHKRVNARSQSGADASEAGVDVLERQIAMAEPMDGEELQHVVVVSREKPVSIGGIKQRLLEV